jgi:hypothetical protein
MQIHINELPAQLESLGSSAFWYGGPNIRITEIPNNLEKLPDSCFYNCPNVIIYKFGSYPGDMI